MILVIMKVGYCHSCRWLEDVASNKHDGDGYTGGAAIVIAAGS